MIIFLIFREFLSIIGPSKLREAFIILDSYKEDEVKVNMIAIYFLLE